jgi:hypothetical protein
MNLRRCLRDPIPEIFEVAQTLEAAVSNHLAGEYQEADQLFALANNPVVRDWTESIWGKNSPYIKVRKIPAPDVKEWVEPRMPTAAQIALLQARDGFRCRFCGILVIPAAVRKRAHALYPASVPWGKTNQSQHAGFQALWAQYDHVVPHSCGGTNALENLVVTCAACNYGKMSYRLEELGLLDPRNFPPVVSAWDGLGKLLTVRTVADYS